MTDLTPRNSFPYPSERELPFWDAFKAGVLAEDAAHFANADNGNLIFLGGGTFGWDAATSTLFWTAEIEVSGFHTPFRATIPVGSVTIQDEEVVFFQMPRMLQANSSVSLFRSSQMVAEGIRLHDLRLFATRSGSTVYFMNGLSLRDGETGTLFGGGLLPLQTVIPHQHVDPWVYIAPAPGLLTLTPLPSIVAPDLIRVDVYRNGALQIEGIDYTVDLNTGVITLVVATVVVPNPDRFVVFREIRDSTVTVSSHYHGPKLVHQPLPGTAALSVLATAPLLLRVDLFRNGYLQVEGAGDDYTIDLNLGIITLATPSVLNDKFELHRYMGIP